MYFTDRAAAGRQLAGRLSHLAGEPLVILGIPRGGVPVAFEVAQALNAPLDVIVVRKLGLPSQPELAMGAVGEDGVTVLREDVMNLGNVSDQQLAQVEQRERAELERRTVRFRAVRKREPLEGRTAVIIDDGIATGSTARAACQVARAHGAQRVVLATPVAPPGWTDRLGTGAGADAGADADADELIAVDTPDPFYSVGQFYEDFAATSDEEVISLLQQSAEAGQRSPGDTPSGAGSHAIDREVAIQAGTDRVGGHLTVPAHPLGIVIFAHGSGSSRHSSRNRYVAEVLNQAGLGTLLMDLLTEPEERSRANVFDIDLLSLRLVHATRWLRDQPQIGDLSIGYFGASTGAAAALAATVLPEARIDAVVSRGGRPDLAGRRLSQVVVPTLLIVGSHDEVVLDLNRQAQAQLHGPSRLEVVPGASHLFEEPGTLQTAAELAREWFVEHFRVAAGSLRP